MTIPWINSEISWDYRAYNLRIAVNHANPADLGSTDKKYSGYDSNAWIFEPKINWGDEKLWSWNQLKNINKLSLQR